MSLSDFIETNLDALIDDWAEFAGQLMREGLPLTVPELQDSARHIFQRVAADMRLDQSGVEQEEKSRGKKGGGAADVTSVALEHADDRLDQGFTLDDVVAEFRALRATVLRRWQQSSVDPVTALNESIRFNEAIDQVLTESIRRYSLRVSETRDRFAGVLAHDLRSPLGAITNSTEFLLSDGTLPTPCVKAVVNIQRSATRMRRMVDDLLDFARVRLGDTLPLIVSPQDAGRVCSNACDEVSASFPQANIEVCLDGDLVGDWDGDRISQLVINLLVNAIQHGEGAIKLSAHGEGDSVTVAVANEGKPIPKHLTGRIFDPLTRTYSPPERRGTAAGVGLGLYICRCIAHAHGGAIAVESADTATVFTVTLPRVLKT
ncbi:sensor histidine kinase [Caballeronia sp. SBC2]|uniref:sensor histidine kinase n=1 Tax=Caballeronia sp. SBC2 TaxID=2705547 RepID=UPI0013E1AD26|nr:sensor histidine kinase [Caballeronia sp. SBC2]QIE29665.1 Adaptive-response sensory-kinase SasA [Caballeronia sp. SBC2]